MRDVAIGGIEAGFASLRPRSGFVLLNPQYGDQVGERLTVWPRAMTSQPAAVAWWRSRGIIM